MPANSELIRSAFEAWNHGDPAVFADHVAEDVVWLEVSGWIEGEGAEVHGREQVRRNLERMLESWQSYRIEPQEIHEVGDDRVVAVVREVARGRSSGADVDSLWGYVVTVADGQIARVEAHRDHTDALREIGG